MPSSGSKEEKVAQSADVAPSQEPVPKGGVATHQSPNEGHEGGMSHPVVRVLRERLQDPLAPQARGNPVIDCHGAAGTVRKSGGGIFRESPEREIVRVQQFDPRTVRDRVGAVETTVQFLQSGVGLELPSEGRLALVSPDLCVTCSRQSRSPRRFVGAEAPTKDPRKG